MALALAALAAAGAARAAGEDPAARLARLRGEVRQLAEERRRLGAEESTLLGRLEALAAEARLQDARVEALGLERAEVERALGAAEARRAAAEAALAEARARLRATVVLLHQAGPLGGLRLAAGAAGEGGGIAAGARLAHELTARRRDEVAGVRAARDDAAAAAAEAAARRAELERNTAEATSARAALATAIAARRQLLARVRHEESARDAAIAELDRAGGELEQLLAGQRGAAPVRLDVKRFRGLLPMPAEGGVDVPFGDRRDPRFGTILPHRGWDVAAPFGAPVAAVFDGRVVWAAWFRGYGLMVVVDHGGGVHSVYGHLSVIAVAQGDEVAKGQLLGKVGDTGPLGGASLYFEMREAGRATDPAAWIAAPR